MNSYPISRKTNIVVQEFETEVLIYDLKINKAYCLNQTSALVYQLCDGTKSVAEISNLMSRKLKMLVSEDFIWLALDGLKKDNLLENNEQFEINFNSLSRRQIIKKVGFASMLMLPIISSVIAPSAAMAQSGLSLLGSACSSNSQCLSGNCAQSAICCVPGSNAVTPGNIICNGSQSLVNSLCCSRSSTPATPPPGCFGPAFTCDPYPPGQ